MQKIYGHIKKIGRLASIVGLTIVIFSQPAKADEIDRPYLQQIQNATQSIQSTATSILTAINTMFQYMTQLNLLATTWLAADNSSSDPVDWSQNWSNEQNWLASLSTSALTNESNQYNMQKNLLTTFFGASNISATPPVPQNLNDLAYISMLGHPLVSPDPRGNSVDVAMNYLTNASGLGITLTPPLNTFRGSADARKNYISFYNTITAVQTYNAFVLSRLYQDSKSESQDSNLRTKLIKQSSDSSWFSAVITNDLGWVLRQVLLYASQNYVLMDQLVQTQKQMAASLAMTNSLLIANNKIQGQALLVQAQGTV